MDTLTKRQRSYCMSRIRRHNTGVEQKLRKFFWKKGIRGWRLKSKLPGKPDLYFPKSKIAVFIDGCFWHKCPKCFIKPKSRLDYWIKKIAGNVKRDASVNARLRKEKIFAIRFWEHEVNCNLDKCYNKFAKEYEKRN